MNLAQKIVASSFARLAFCACLVFGAFATEAMASDTLSIWVMDNGLGSKNAMKRLVKKFYRETGRSFQKNYVHVCGFERCRS